MFETIAKAHASVRETFNYQSCRTMTSEEQHIDLIQKYLRSELAPKVMEQMRVNIQKDTVLAQEVADYQLLIEGIEAKGAFDFVNKVASWEQKYRLKKTDFEKQVKEEKTYLLEELLELFQPVRAYEKRIEKELVGTRQIGGLEVKKPENGVDCRGEIVFELVAPIDDELKLVIEDNEEEEVYKTFVKAKTQSFEVNIVDWKPGRYYWKLRSKKYGMILRSFFIQKHLYPNA